MVFIRENNTVNDFTPGDKVLYVPMHAINQYIEFGTHYDTEFGIVKSINEKYVFVNYTRNGIVQETAQATDPKDLIKYGNR
jgi:hypothetical protein